MSESSNIIERRYFRLVFPPEGEFAELVIKSDVLYDERDARDTKSLLEERRPGHRYYLLVSAETFFRVTKKVRKMGASRDFSTHLAAVACYTNNISLSLLGELYNKINKPFVPTRIFASREAALDWLQEQRLNTVTGTQVNESKGRA